MTITVSRYQHVSGRDYCQITLKNHHDVQVDVLNYGATLAHYYVPSTNGPKNMVLSLPMLQDYSRARTFLGGTVGRVIGRIAHGRWRESERVHTFLLNDGVNHAHGGLAGLDTQIFSFRTQQVVDGAQVTLEYLDSAGHNGYPGNLHVVVTYTLDDQDTLHYHVDAVSDALTLCNIANHAYFNLDGGGTILGQSLMVDADTYLPLNVDSIPTGERQTVEGTCFDLRVSPTLGKVLASDDSQIISQHGLNHAFLLNRHPIAAQLTAPQSQRRLTVMTTAPAIVAYTGNHFNHDGGAMNLGQYSGVALETQAPPTADETLSAITLQAGERFERETSWQIEY